MKKVVYTLLISGIFSICACGPSAEDKAKEEKARQDSIKAIQDLDSMMKAQSALGGPDTAKKMPADTIRK